MSTPPAAPSAETPERLAFYERISQTAPDAAVDVAGEARHARAGQRLPAGRRGRSRRFARR